METLILIFFFIIGTVFGSFYTVIGMRIPVHESIIHPRSHCEKCGHVLRWFELIPVFSFVFLKGKCRYCKTKLSWLYLVLELSSGILFAISYYSYGFSLDLIIALILSSLMIIVTSSDLSYMIIPDSFIFIPCILIFIIKIFTVGLKASLVAVLYGIIGFGVMFLIMKFGSWLFKKECLGGADVKLMFLVGLVLPSFLSILVIVLASLIALPVSLFLYFKNKENAIPFGPFIVLGLLIIFFMKLDVNDIITFLTLR